MITDTPTHHKGRLPNAHTARKGQARQHVENHVFRGAGMAPTDATDMLFHRLSEAQKCAVQIHGRICEYLANTLAAGLAGDDEGPFGDDEHNTNLFIGHDLSHFNRAMRLIGSLRREIAMRNLADAMGQ